MSLTKTKDTSVIDSYVESIDLYLPKMKTIITNYSTSCSNIDTQCSNANAPSTWDDEVYTALIGQTTKISSFSSTMQTETSSGNLNTLYSSISSLKTKLGTYKSKIESYNSYDATVSSLANATAFQLEERYKRKFPGKKVPDMWGANPQGARAIVMDALGYSDAKRNRDAIDLDEHWTKNIDPLLTKISNLEFDTVYEENDNAIGALADLADPSLSYDAEEAVDLSSDAAQLALAGKDAGDNDDIPGRVETETVSGVDDEGNPYDETNTHVVYDNGAETNIHTIETSTPEGIPTGSASDINITLSDGTQLTGDQNAEYWADGSLRSANTAISDEDGNSVYTEIVTSGTSLMCTLESHLTTTLNPDGSTTTTFTRTSGIGDSTVSEVVGAITLRDDPNATIPGHSQVGSIELGGENGEIITQFRDDDGVLYRQRSYLDKNGERVYESPVKVSDNPEDYVTVYRIDLATNEVSSITVNPNSQLDSHMLEYYLGIDKSRITTETGTGLDYSALMGYMGKNIDITYTPMLGDGSEGCVYSLTPPEGYGGN